jgi:hypothetical protein
MPKPQAIPSKATFLAFFFVLSQHNLNTEDQFYQFFMLVSHTSQTHPDFVITYLSVAVFFAPNPVQKSLE